MALVRLRPAVAPDPLPLQSDLGDSAAYEL